MVGVAVSSTTRVAEAVLSVAFMATLRVTAGRPQERQENRKLSAELSGLASLLLSLVACLSLQS